MSVVDLSSNRFFREIHRYAPLAPAEEYALLVAAQAGDYLSEQKLIKHNLAFVLQFALNNYYYREDWTDLVDSGVIGLHTAIQRYDLSKHYRLCTYAKPYIMKAMQEYVAEDKLVRIPDHVQRQINHHELDMYQVERLDAPQYNEENEVDDWSCKGPDNYNKAEYQAIDSEDMPDRPAQTASTMDMIMAYLGSVSAKKTAIWLLSNGLTDGEEHSPQTVASYFNISRERVRQINQELRQRLQSSVNRNEVA